MDFFRMLKIRPKVILPENEHLGRFNWHNNIISSARTREELSAIEQRLRNLDLPREGEQGKNILYLRIESKKQEFLNQEYKKHADMLNQRAKEMNEIVKQRRGKE